MVCVLVCMNHVPFNLVQLVAIGTKTIVQTQLHCFISQNSESSVVPDLLYTFIGYNSTQFFSRCKLVQNFMVSPMVQWQRWDFKLLSLLSHLPCGFKSCQGQTTICGQRTLYGKVFKLTCSGSIQTFVGGFPLCKNNWMLL